MKLKTSILALCSITFAAACTSSESKLSDAAVKLYEGQVALNQGDGRLINSTASFSLFDNGRIAYNGQVPLQLPGTEVRQFPINKDYGTKLDYFRSDFYRQLTPEGLWLPVDRLWIRVVGVDLANNRAQVIAKVSAHHTHWTDALYGAELITAELNISDTFAKPISITVQNGWAFFDATYNLYRPASKKYRSYFTQPGNLNNGANFTLNFTYPGQDK